MERRVVITGSSAITPIGHGKDQIVESLLKGTSGVKPLREDEFLGRYIHSRVYGTVDYPVDYDFKRNHRKTMGPVAYYACQVARKYWSRRGSPMILSRQEGWEWPLVLFMVLRQCREIFTAPFLKLRKSATRNRSC